MFERLPRGVRLTGAGELYLAHVRRAFKELHTLETQIEQLRGQTRGSVRIAVAESVTPSLLPKAIATYRRAHPGVEFHVIVDGPERLSDVLLRDGVDLILTHERTDKPGLTVLGEVGHPLCALVAPEHPLARGSALKLSDCVPYPWAVPDQTLAARVLLDLALQHASLSMAPTLESNSIETLKTFARLGEAVCFSFHLGNEADALGLVALRLRDRYCSEARLYLVARRGRVLPVAAAAFAEQLKDELSETSASSSMSRL